LSRLREAPGAWGLAIYSPAAIATKTPSCAAATPPAPPRKPSTAPAASTSTTAPPGSDPRRI